MPAHTKARVPRRRNAAVRLVALPRHPLLVAAVLLIGLGILLSLRSGTAVVQIGAGNRAARNMGPEEYVPMLVAGVLTPMLAPRFVLWERYGAASTTRLALATVALVTLSPLALLLVGLLRGDLLASEPGRQAALALVSNTLIYALASVIATATIGRLLGPITWAVGMFLLLTEQSQAPTWWARAPLSAGYTYDLQSDLTPRWWWVLLLGIAALSLAWWRRLVPMRLAVRTAESDA